ncbi:hypothetical protein D3C71_1403670 [compost metagenome]
MYLHSDAPASEKLIKFGLSSHFCCKPLSPSRLRIVSSVPSGLKKNRKIKPIATPFSKVGKNKIPLNKFFMRTLKLRMVAKYKASAI